MRYLRLARQQGGFTIIELLIATLTFSMILVAITTSIMQITRTYYKGTIATQTQSTARSIIDTLSQAIQFSGTAIQVNQTDNTKPFYDCVGGREFIFTLDKELSDNATLQPWQTHHALLMLNNASCSSYGSMDAAYAASSTEPLELLTPHMRLVNLSITPLQPVTSQLFRITVKVTYGDNDLLNHTVPSTDPSYDNCLATTGSQFCASSELSTIVQRRLSK